jgi:Lhr-like helicase
MAEYGKPGTKFIIRGSPWMIQNVSEERVHVKPIDDPTGAIPSWIGEEIPVPFEVSQEVGGIREFVEERLKKKIKELWNEILDGKFALMTPVMTSTDGRCVAMMRWIPTARAFCARRVTESSTSFDATIIRSANSSMMITM